MAHTCVEKNQRQIVLCAPVKLKQVFPLLFSQRGSSLQHCVPCSLLFPFFLWQTIASDEKYVCVTCMDKIGLSKLFCYSTLPT